MSSTLYLSSAPPGLIRFPPSSEPLTLHPPPGSTPFHIPEDIYSRLLETKVPITIALLYAITVSLLNVYNKSRGNKPWSISRTNFFFIFVVLHNIFLAVYSGWTFLGMWKTLQTSVVWPLSPNGVVRMVDSLCKIHGPQGLGEAVVYNVSTSQWVPQSTSSALNEIAATNLQAFGRIWNEGLAFYGWLFYISKFYEVLDTFIILAKGKNSGLLQTYHHTGAMLCMWAGIRYMSPPIWMFVFVNSAIHALMYTYFTFTTFNIQVAQFLKRSLTTIQILQFVVGALYAAIHTFISYSYNYEVPFVETVLKETVSATTSAINSIATSNSFAEKIKAFLITSLGRSSIVYTEQELPEIIKHEGFRVEKMNVSCLDTSGQNFAVWLNVFYLTPLTYLFLKFFFNTYLRRSTKSKNLDRKNDMKSLTPAKKC